MRISGRVAVSSTERVQRLPAPFLSELRDLRHAVERRGRSVTDLGRFAIKIPAPSKSEISEEPLTHVKNVFAEYLDTDHSVVVDPEREMTLLPGTKVAMLVLAAFLADSDTTVHLPDPGYEAYRTSALLFDARIKTYPLFQRNDFLPNLELFSERKAKSAGVIVINSPHNPTGAVCDNAFYERLRKIAAAGNTLVVADSAYALTASGNYRPTLFGENRRRLRVGLEMFSFSTSLCAPGLRLTAVIGTKNLIQPLTALSRLLSLDVPSSHLGSASRYFASYATLKNHLTNCREQIAERTHLVVEQLKSAGIEFYPVCHSGFIWIKLRHRRVSLSFSRSLLRQRGVLVAPGSAFGEQGEGWIRVSLNVGGTALSEAVAAVIRHSQPIKTRLGEIRHE